MLWCCSVTSIMRPSPMEQGTSGGTEGPVPSYWKEGRDALATLPLAALEAAVEICVLEASWRAALEAAAVLVGPVAWKV